MKSVSIIFSTAANTGLLLDYLSVDVSVDWARPAEPSGNLTRYEAVLVFSPLSPREEAVEGVTEFPPDVTNGNVSMMFPRPFARELVVFFHVCCLLAVCVVCI